MLNSILKYAGVVALVILAIMGGMNLLSSRSSFGTAVDCGSTTCFTTLGALTSFQDDGTAIFNGAVTFASTLVQSSASTFASTTITALKIGQLGTQQANAVVTTCSIQSDASAGATTTVYAYCTGVTGVTSADTILAGFATSTTALQDNWWITGAKASTTAGAIDFKIYNGSGRAQAFSAATTIGSSTVIRAGH